MPTVHFQSKWKSEFPWVKEGRLKHTAECIWCKSSFSYETMGRAALSSHAKGKRHQATAVNREKTIPLTYFIQPASTELQSTSNQNIPSSSLAPSVTISSSDLNPHNLGISTLDKYTIKDKVTEAEILWCVNSVMNHSSLRSAENSVQLFSHMFPDSTIAQEMKLHKDKISYSLVYGLSPYLKDNLKTSLKECTHYVVGFDESLNKVAQRSQMDLCVRFFDINTNTVKARYLDSVFLNQAKATDLLEAFKIGISGLDCTKIVQISMDGPNVNWSFLGMIKEDFKLNSKVPDTPELLELGSCGLHVLHGAFKTGIVKTEWKTIQFLRALYNLFKMVPARRGHFMDITGSSLFPLPFCTIRWIENSNVAKRAQEVLPSVIKYVETVSGTNKEPSCQSFQIVKSALKDSLLSAKLAFFQSLAENLEPFLKEFQTDAPMVPFLYQTLLEVVKGLMYKFVKRELMTKDSFHRTDVFEKEDKIFKNVLPAKEVDLGYATRAAVRKCKGVTNKELMYFRTEVRTCMQHVVNKIQEKSPLKYGLTKATSFLDPSLIARNGTEACQNMKNCFDILTKENIITPYSAEKADKEFRELLLQESFQCNAKSYKRNEKRLDEFWFDTDRRTEPIGNLQNVVKIILILSHGNASVERGFSVNKEILVENMREDSLVAQRVIYDAVKDAGGLEVWSKEPIPKKMVFSMRNAYCRFKEAEDYRKKSMTEKDRRAAEKRKAQFQLKELECKKRKVLEKMTEEMSKIESEIKQLRS